MSIISTATAASLGLDLASPESTVPVGGVDGITVAPSFTIDRLGLVTEQGIELVWNNVQVIALDIDPSLSGVLGSDVLNSSRGQLGGLDLDGLFSSAGAMEAVHFDFRQLDTSAGRGTLYVDLNSSYDDVQDAASQIEAGDANQDLQFDQLDMVQVLQRNKYLTGQAATWGDGDWDGAPGGTAGNPPPGNGLFDQADIVASLQHGLYTMGPYSARGPVGTLGDGLMFVVGAPINEPELVQATVPEPASLVLVLWTLPCLYAAACRRR